MWELATRLPPWNELDATNYLEQFSRLDAALRSDRRPTIPDGFASKNSVYTTTMQACWATDPAVRPSFTKVTTMLEQVPAERSSAFTSLRRESQAPGEPRRTPSAADPIDFRYATVHGGTMGTALSGDGWGSASPAAADNAPLLSMDEDGGTIYE